jgi:hypothetical protein
MNGDTATQRGNLVIPLFQNIPAGIAIRKAEVFLHQMKAQPYPRRIRVLHELEGSYIMS